MPGSVAQRFERPRLPPIRLHDLRHGALRHGAATPALAAAKGIQVVSAMLRHSSRKITGALYASVLPELTAEASEAVASMIPPQADDRRLMVLIVAPHGFAWLEMA